MYKIEYRLIGRKEWYDHTDIPHSRNRNKLTALTIALAKTNRNYAFRVVEKKENK